MNEAEIQKSIIEYLTLCGHLVCRMPLGGIRHQKNGRTFFKKNPLKGFPDLFFLHADRSGRLFTVEVKTKTGRQTQEQKDWERRLSSFGVKCILARSVEDVKASLSSSYRETIDV